MIEQATIPAKAEGLRLASPFPEEHLPLVWQWMNEFPEANIDDYGPRTLEAFLPYAKQRLQVERSWALFKGNKPCAVIAYIPFTERLGFFHGICFAKGNCSSEEKRWVVLAIVEELFNSGIEKVCAQYFADNERIEKLFADLGAVSEGYFSRHTMRSGLPVDVTQVAFLKAEPTKQ